MAAILFGRAPTSMASTDTSARPAEAESIDQPMLIAGVAALDTFLVIVSALVAAALAPVPVHLSPLFLGAAMSGAVLFALQRAWCYTVPSLAHLVRQTARVALGLGGAFAVLFALVAVAGLEQETPRSFLVIWWAITFAVLIASRAVLAWRIGRWIAEGRLLRRAVIVGAGRPAEDLIAQLRRSTTAGIKICGVFDDRAKDRSAIPSNATACSGPSRSSKPSVGRRGST